MQSISMEISRQLNVLPEVVLRVRPNHFRIPHVCDVMQGPNSNLCPFPWKVQHSCLECGTMLRLRHGGNDESLQLRVTFARARPTIVTGFAMTHCEQLDKEKEFINDVRNRISSRLRSMESNNEHRPSIISGIPAQSR